MNQGTVAGVPGIFPTENAYNLIFITAAFVSLASAAMAFYVTQRTGNIPEILTSNHQQDSSSDRT